MSQSFVNNFDNKLFQGISTFSIYDIKANPALNASFDNQLYFDYSPNSFGLPELSPSNSLINYRNEKFTHTFNHSGINFSKFVNYALSFINSYSVTEDFIFGLSINYNNFRIQNFNDDYFISFDIGAISKLDENFFLSFSILNFTQSNYSLHNSNSSSVFGIGVLFYLEDYTNINLNSTVSDFVPFSLNLSFERELAEDFLKLRLSYNTNPVMFEIMNIVSIEGYFDLLLRYNYHFTLLHSITVGGNLYF